MPLERYVALLTGTLLPSASRGEKFIHSFNHSVTQHLVWTSYSSGLRSTKINKQAESMQTLLLLKIHKY